MIKKNIVVYLPLALLSSCSVFMNTQSNFDIFPESKGTSYLYAPGMMGSEFVMARYCPSFTASTGEKIVSKSGGNVIGQPHSAVTFPEVDLRKPTFSCNPVTFCINSLRMLIVPVAQRIMQYRFDFTIEDNPGSSTSVINYFFDFSKANLGQEADVQTLEQAYQEHLKKYPETDIVLYGDSRGAATIFNFVANHKPAYVKAAILEGIYDSLDHIIKHFITSNKSTFTEKLLHRLARITLGGYKNEGMNQRESAEIIDDTIPLLLVISLKDGQVPAQSAFYLYSRLIQRGHKQVHLLVLEKSLHPIYMMDDPEDKKVYESVVHAFYKHYNLPHDSALAHEGKHAFAATQPTPEFLKEIYNLSPCALCIE